MIETDSYAEANNTMTDAEILGEYCALHDLGPLFDGNQFDFFIAREYGNYLWRARTLIESALAKLPKMPPVHAEFVRNPAFNAFAVKYQDRHFIGINDSIPLVVSLIVNRMLADPNLFTHVGDCSKESATLPVFTAFTLDASALAPAGIQHVYPLDPLRAVYANHLCNMIFDFLAAHELAHHTHGHVDYDAAEYGLPCVSELRFMPDTPEANLESQSMEMDADLTAAFPFLLTMKRIVGDRLRLPQPLADLYSDPAQAIFDAGAAVSVLFRLFEYSYAPSGSPTEGTHPPSRIRQRLILLALGNYAEWFWDGSLFATAETAFTRAIEEIERGFGLITGTAAQLDRLHEAFGPAGLQYAITLAECWNTTLMPKFQQRGYTKDDLSPYNFGPPA